ncbi:MAG TPA: SDR family oxidoreductase [Ferruginibacter sp.]|nr:SDR family oxidoreductase [Ferruginibacter sp.]
MNLIVFGATGLVGKQLVQQALFNGHHVKAFGRNVFTTDFLETKDLELVQGALFDATEVYNAIKGCDAVLSAIGGGFDSGDKTRTLGMKNIIAQMKKAGVQRIIAIGAQAILNADENTLVMDKDDYPEEYKPVSKEHFKVYQMLNESGLDWTLVGPSDIADHGPTGSYIIKADYPPDPLNDRINSGDLAMFMLNELSKNEYIHHRVGISN